MEPDPCGEAPAGQARPEPCRVLLVDDDPTFLADLRDLLGTYMSRLQFVTAGDGGQGLAALDGGPVDLIISDFNMPGMDGLQFLDAAKQRAPGVPRVLLSGDPRFTPSTSADIVRERRACAVINKPPQSESTVATVRRLLRGRCIDSPTAHAA